MFSTIPRIIPILLIDEKKLIKPLQFKNPVYVGDPINTVKLFNDKEAQELIILDISISKKNKPIDFDYLKQVATESFIPLCYGGGIKTLEDVKKILHAGYEKISLNTAFHNNPKLAEAAANQFGSQSIVVSIDYYIDFWGKTMVYIASLNKKTKFPLAEYCKKAEEFGAGEILLTSVYREGTFKGYDLDTIKSVSAQTTIPVIANGGATNLEDIKACLTHTGASAAGAGSLFIFYGSRNAVLVNYPSEEEIATLKK